MDQIKQENKYHKARVDFARQPRLENIARANWFHLVWCLSIGNVQHKASVFQYLQQFRK